MNTNGVSDYLVVGAGAMGMAFVDVAEEYNLAQDRCKELVDRIAALGDAQDRKTNILSRPTSTSSGSSGSRGSRL